MKRVGEVLKQEREKRGLALEEVERATKIRAKLLSALEESEYQKLPPPTYVRGFIRNYAEFLGLSRESLLALYRREVDEKKQALLPHAVVSPIVPRLTLTPGRILIIFVAVILTGFFFYIGRELTLLAGAPSLKLESPKDNLRASSSTLEVSGQTDPEVKLTINGQEVRTLPDGKFQTQINLVSGQNTIEVVSESKRGKKSEIKRTVFFAP